MARMSNSRKNKVIERMIRADLNAWRILFRIAYFVPLSQLEHAYKSEIAESVGMTYVKSEQVYGIRTDKELGNA